jgi:hypothetical protein
MPTYTVTPASVGTQLQATAGSLQTIQMISPPTGAMPPSAFDGVSGVPVSNYLTFYDPTPAVPRVLFAAESSQPIPPAPSALPVGAYFTKLWCGACPPGASYTITTQ